MELPRSPFSFSFSKRLRVINCSRLVDECAILRGKGVNYGEYFFPFSLRFVIERKCISGKGQRGGGGGYGDRLGQRKKRSDGRVFRIDLGNGGGGRERVAREERLRTLPCSF